MGGGGQGALTCPWKITGCHLFPRRKNWYDLPSGSSPPAPVGVVWICTRMSDGGILFFICSRFSNSCTMGCTHVRGDNPRALASGLSYVQVNKHVIIILYHLYQCRPCTSQDISC